MAHPSLSPAVLADLTRQLLERQTALRAGLQAAAHAALAEQAEPIADTKDRAEERIEHAMDDEASTRAARELAEVSAALARLDQGRYGTCLRCGRPIPQQRLLAVPAAPLCAGCQSLQEHGADPTARHLRATG